MRCNLCGRMMSNAELWHLAGNRNAPSSTAMSIQCWSCRVGSAKGLASPPSQSTVSQASEIVRHSHLHARQHGGQPEGGA